MEYSVTPSQNTVLRLIRTHLVHAVHPPLHVAGEAIVHQLVHSPVHEAWVVRNLEFRRQHAVACTCQFLHSHTHLKCIYNKLGANHSCVRDTYHATDDLEIRLRSPAIPIPPQGLQNAAKLQRREGPARQNHTLSCLRAKHHTLETGSSEINRRIDVPEK